MARKAAVSDLLHSNQASGGAKRTDDPKNQKEWNEPDGEESQHGLHSEPEGAHSQPREHPVDHEARVAKSKSIISIIVCSFKETLTSVRYSHSVEWDLECQTQHREECLRRVVVSMSVAREQERGARTER